MIKPQGYDKEIERKMLIIQEAVAYYLQVKGGNVLDHKIIEMQQFAGTFLVTCGGERARQQDNNLKQIGAK